MARADQREAQQRRTAPSSSSPPRTFNDVACWPAKLAPGRSSVVALERTATGGAPVGSGGHAEAGWDGQPHRDQFAQVGPLSTAPLEVVPAERFERHYLASWGRVEQTIHVRLLSVLLCTPVVRFGGFGAHGRCLRPGVFLTTSCSLPARDDCEPSRIAHSISSAEPSGPSKSVREKLNRGQAGVTTPGPRR